MWFKLLLLHTLSPFTKVLLNSTSILRLYSSSHVNFFVFYHAIHALSTFQLTCFSIRKWHFIWYKTKSLQYKVHTLLMETTSKNMCTRLTSSTSVTCRYIFLVTRLCRVNTLLLHIKRRKKNADWSKHGFARSTFWISVNDLIYELHNFEEIA